MWYYSKYVWLTALLFMGLCLGSKLSAQQDPHYAQYMFNHLVINPGYTGTHDQMELTALGRFQWVGFKGAPTTQSFAGHTPLRNDKLGVGLSVVADQIGVRNDVMVNGSFAYKLQLNYRTFLSFGAQGGVRKYSISYSSLEDVSSRNQTFDQLGDVSRWAPNIGLGAYLYDPRKFYLGLSAPRVLDGDIMGANPGEFNPRRHYFLSGGYVFDVHHNWKLKPNFLVKAVEGAPFQMDLNLNALYNEIFWVGLSYRQGYNFLPESLHTIFQVVLNPQWQVGYAFELPLTDIRRATHGSHEIMVNYTLKFSKDRVVTPRYF